MLSFIGVCPGLSFKTIENIFSKIKKMMLEKEKDAYILLSLVHIEISNQCFKTNKPAILYSGSHLGFQYKSYNYIYCDLISYSFSIRK